MTIIYGAETSIPLPGIEHQLHDRPTHSLVVTATELSRLLYLHLPVWWVYLCLVNISSCLLKTVRLYKKFYIFYWLTERYTLNFALWMNGTSRWYARVDSEQVTIIYTLRPHSGGPSLTGGMFHVCSHTTCVYWQSLITERHFSVLKRYPHTQKSI
jgi:hypothetical protein